MYRAAFFALAAIAIDANTQTLPPLPQLRTGAPPLAASGAVTKFTFIVAGDNRPAHRGDPLTTPLLDIIKRLKGSPAAFVVWDGDTVFGKGSAGLYQQYEQFRRAFRRVKVPLFNAPGNHEMVVQTNIPCGSAASSWNAELPDYSGIMPATYQKAMAPAYGMFRYGNAAFLVLNTDDVPDVAIPTACDYTGFVGLAQLNALQATLDQLSADDTVTHIFLFMHRPIRNDNFTRFAVKGAAAETDYGKRVAAFTSLIDSAAHPKVAFVFASHDHRLYIDPAPVPLTQHVPLSGPPTFIVTGGAGAPLTGCPGTPAGSYFHTIAVTVDGANVGVAVQPLYGTTPCTAPPPPRPRSGTNVFP
jgi:hypothetical protein